MSERKPRSRDPVENIDESDRVAFIKRMDERGITKADLADACDVTRSAITLLLAKPIPKGKTRGCKFLAKIQAALGLAVTAKRPVAIPSDKARRAELILRAFGDDTEGLEHWLENGEMLASRTRKSV